MKSMERSLELDKKIGYVSSRSISQNLRNSLVSELASYAPMFHTDEITMVTVYTVLLLKSNLFMIFLFLFLQRRIT